MLNSTRLRSLLGPAGHMAFVVNSTIVPEFVVEAWI